MSCLLVTWRRRWGGSKQPSPLKPKVVLSIIASLSLHSLHVSHTVSSTCPVSFKFLTVSMGGASFQWYLVLDLKTQGCGQCWRGITAGLSDYMFCAWGLYATKQKALDYFTLRKISRSTSEDTTSQATSPGLFLISCFSLLIKMRADVFY
jgi:hypothetical protein